MSPWQWHCGFPNSGLRTKHIPTLSRNGGGGYEWLPRDSRSYGMWARPYNFPGQLVKTFPSIKMVSITTLSWLLSTWYPWGFYMSGFGRGGGRTPCSVEDPDTREVLPSGWSHQKKPRASPKLHLSRSESKSVWEAGLIFLKPTPLTCYPTKKRIRH